MGGRMYTKMDAAWTSWGVVDMRKKDLFAGGHLIADQWIFAEMDWRGLLWGIRRWWLEKDAVTGLSGRTKNHPGVVWYGVYNT